MSYCKVNITRVLRRAFKLRAECLVKVKKSNDLYCKNLKKEEDYRRQSFWFRLITPPPELLYYANRFFINHYPATLRKCDEIITLCKQSRGSINLSKEDAFFLFGGDK